MKDAFFETIPPSGFAFADAGLDRVSARRDDAVYLNSLREDPRARYVLIARDMPILARDTHAPFWPRALAASLGPSSLEILLGLDAAGAPYFAALLPDAAVEQRAAGGDGFLDQRVLV